MDGGIAFIGFGEAGQAFADGLGQPARAYDRKTYVGPTRRAKLNDYDRLGVQGALTNQAAVEGAGLILSLVTADKAPAAARETARGIEPDALYCDMNSVAPQTKREAEGAIELAGAHYIDVAIMAPVHPAGRAVPLLVSGPQAERAAQALSAIGFGNVRVVAGGVGTASAIKMIRSVMVKGIEALTAECVLAAEAAGVRDEVIASLDASWPGADWSRRADYNLDRMMVHGLRRAAEMEEVVRTLDVLGTGSAMSRGTVERQRAIGSRAITPSATLDAKVAALLDRSKDQAA
jgi:3-hydroxyisobutyrate dehydrogenase-like beta-hydroxyacid dehydrogenase